MSLAMRDSVSRVADAARDFATDVATALQWLEAVKRDFRGARAVGGACAARAGR